MPRESDLLDPIVGWLLKEFGTAGKILIHEEPRGRGGRRPDVLVVFSDDAFAKVDDVTIVPIEIEVSSRAAIHDRHNGLSQLRKYHGHAKFLAIPRSVANRLEAREIPNRCGGTGAGLLVADISTGEVVCEVNPTWSDPIKGLRGYPVTMRRWLALRVSKDSYRRISHRRIVDRA